MKIKDLTLAVSATPKKADIRYYLNGILITHNHIVASDGQRLVRIKENDNAMPENLEKLIIPVEAVKNFLKKFTKKEQERYFEVVKIGEQFALQHGNAIEVFEPINSKYPDFQKAFDKIEAERLEPNADAHYNYEYLGATQKAINVYLGSDTPKKFHRRDTLGYFEPVEGIIYIVMPCSI
jgi:hypothetical protein